MPTVGLTVRQSALAQGRSCGATAKAPDVRLGGGFVLGSKVAGAHDAVEQLDRRGRTAQATRSGRRLRTASAAGACAALARATQAGTRLGMLRGEPG